MRDLNMFESVFKRALRTRFEYQKLRFDKILLITDLASDALLKYQASIKAFIAPVAPEGTYLLEVVGKDDFHNWITLQAILEKVQPDLIISYRLLRIPDQQIRSSLGVYIDTLSQMTPHPVLVLPNPHLFPNPPSLNQDGKVVVATEHLYEDHSLVNFGLHFTRKGAGIILVHIEDEDTFEYYMSAIEKIPELDTEIARHTLRKQLKAGPEHYAESVAEVVDALSLEIKVESINDFGHLISRYSDLIRKEPVNLLVFHTKDDTQMAMHSLGYSLAIEFKEIPVLLI